MTLSSSFWGKFASALCRALSSVSRGVVESSRMQSVAALFAQHVRRDGLRFAEADADGDNVLTFPSPRSADAAGCGGGS